MNKKLVKVFSLVLVVAALLTSTAFAANDDSRTINTTITFPQNVSVTILPINNLAPVTVTTNDYVPVFQTNAPVVVTTNDTVPVNVNDAQVPVTISFFSKFFKFFK